MSTENERQDERHHGNTEEGSHEEDEDEDDDSEDDDMEQQMKDIQDVSFDRFKNQQRMEITETVLELKWEIVDDVKMRCKRELCDEK